MRARDRYPDRVKRRFTIFTLNKDAEHSGEKWKSVRSVPSNVKLKEEIEYLKEIGVTDMRVTITTRRVLLDTEKNIDEMTGWEPRRHNEEETE